MKSNIVMNSNIQILRAIAILMVIFQHYRNRLPSPEWYLNTFNYINYWPAVDLFLSISGYLMAKSLISQIKSHSNKMKVFKTYLYHRLFRLVPCLFFWGCISIVASYILQPAWGFSPLKSFNTLYTSLLGYSNVHFYICTKQGIDCDQMNAVTWSLSLEWQLYALIAIIMLYCNKKIYIPIFLTIIGLSLAMPIKPMYYTSIGWWLRPQAFFLGAIIYLVPKKITLKKSTTLLITLFCFTLLLSAPKVEPIFLMIPLISLASAIILLLFITDNLIKINYTPANKILTWVGDRSYSIYLCHLPALHITRESLNHLLIGTQFYENKWIYFATFILITLPTANLTFKYIEKVFIRLGKTYLSHKERHTLNQ